MKNKIYNMTCCDCGKNVELKYSSYISARRKSEYRCFACSRIKIGISQTGMIKKSAGKTKKMYDVTCAKCLKVRSLCYDAYYPIKVSGNTLCNSCSRGGTGVVGERKGINQAIRKMSQYNKWRYDVFKRDKFECSVCGKTGYIEAHHKYPLQSIIDDYKIESLLHASCVPVLFDIDNGISLCEDCHKDTHRAK